jgi:hypothetical protein
MHRVLLLAFALVACTALAEEGDGDDGYEDLPAETAPAELKHRERFSFQVGWKPGANDAFYRNYYTEYPDLPRAPTSPGGPLLVGSFAHSYLEYLEFGLDLVATGQRLRLTGQPTLNTVMLAALVGMRFQLLMRSVGPEGLVPFVGVLLGPTIILSDFEGLDDTTQETGGLTIGGCAGATLRLSPRWGLTAEYRLVAGQGRVGTVRQPDLTLQSFSPFTAGGHWFSLGVTYVWPPKARKGTEPFGRF